jgi:preprotein translocase subunit SecG
MAIISEDNQGETLTRTLAIVAIVLSVLALVWSYQGAKRSREALNEVHNIQTTTKEDGSQAPGLMQGTDQPPTQPTTQGF